VEDLHHITPFSGSPVFVTPYAQFIVASPSSSTSVTVHFDSGQTALAYPGHSTGPGIGSNGTANASPIWIEAMVDGGGAGMIGAAALEGGKSYPAQLVGIDPNGQRIYRVVSTLSVQPYGGGPPSTLTQQLWGDVDNLISFEHPFGGIDALKLQGETLSIDVLSPGGSGTMVGTNLVFTKGILSSSSVGGLLVGYLSGTLGG
jgi:hypothetical protein